MVSFVNNVKTVILLGGLMGLFVAVGGALGGVQNLILFGAIGAVVNVGAFWFSDKIAIKTMRGQEVGEDHPLYGMVDRLRQNAGLPMPRVYVCPQPAPNAFATGRSPSNAAVAVTQGALQLLTERELEGVMAHELAHVKNRDTLISTIAAIVAGLLAMLAQWSFFFIGGRNENSNPLVSLGVIILAAVGAAVIRAMISRSREFVADADGAAIAGSPDGLISALQKLEVYAQRIPMQNPNPAQNNLFIVEPFSGNKTMMNLFATHPPTEKRVEALRRAG
ncbi:MAG: M48 family metalloprotease [Planctomycetota bacterium]